MLILKQAEVEQWQAGITVRRGTNPVVTGIANALTSKSSWQRPGNHSGFSSLLRRAVPKFGWRNVGSPWFCQGVRFFGPVFDRFQKTWWFGPLTFCSPTNAQPEADSAFSKWTDGSPKKCCYVHHIHPIYVRRCYMSSYSPCTQDFTVTYVDSLFNQLNSTWFADFPEIFTILRILGLRNGTWFPK